MTQSVLHSVVEGDIPPGGEVFTLRAPGGVDIRVARWTAPENRASCGTVLLFHGYTEFIEKYYEVIGILRARGYSVVTFDWRGQGLSTRLLSNRCKGHVEDYADFLSDALLVHQQCVVDLPRPHVLLAHSMGGHLALRFLQDYPGRFDKAVLSAPMMGWDQFPLGVARAIAATNVALGMGTSYTWVRGDPDPNNQVNDITSDQARFKRGMAFWDKVPDLKLGGPTWRWLQQATSSIARILDRDRLIRVKTPVLVASAGRDKIISSDRHLNLPFLNTTFTVMPIAKAMHEILQETDEIQAQFWKGFDQFVA
ncbi:MAG: alpha/beta hydrolase [Candidatus Binatia bacterium]|nr:alpha/beta hydrolase [Candidatus Binatia bacterium]